MGSQNEVRLLPQILPAVPSKVATDKGPAHQQLEAARKIGPNEECPCGRFGKKFKNCCEYQYSQRLAEDDKK